MSPTPDQLNGPHVVTAPGGACRKCGVRLDARGRNKSGLCRVCRGATLADAVKTEARLDAMQARIREVAPALRRARLMLLMMRPAVVASKDASAGPTAKSLDESVAAIETVIGVAKASNSDGECFDDSQVETIAQEGRLSLSEVEHMSRCETCRNKVLGLDADAAEGRS